MKIAIIGNPGSGKSTLASKLHHILGIPIYHLDQYFWKPGWQRPTTSFGTVRASSAEGCPERIPDREFLRYVWNFNRKNKPEIEAIVI